MHSGTVRLAARDATSSAMEPPQEPGGLATTPDCAQILRRITRASITAVENAVQYARLGSGRPHLGQAVRVVGNHQAGRKTARN
jgi:hypothetical protein